MQRLLPQKEFREKDDIEIGCKFYSPAYHCKNIYHCSGDIQEQMAEENGPYFLKISQQDKKYKLFM